MDEVGSATSPACVLARYALYGAIGAGGMATVHLGRQLGAEGFSRAVAIKRLHSHFAREPELAAMLVDEARLASRIHHPNVVPILDVVTERGEVFLILEYIHGDSLNGLSSRSRQQHAPIPPKIASAIVTDVLYGLSAAHEARDTRGEPLGLVHRDVSPQNVIVGVDGTARLLDFGVAKAAGRLQTTREGALKGKVGYMAPELMQHLGVTPRADVYAAGVVLWECLTNRRLFGSHDDAATIAQVLVGLVDPPSKHVPEISEELDDLVLKALNRDPERRFASAREMALALEQAVPPARPVDVATWMQPLAAEELARREAMLAQMERDPVLNPPTSVSQGSTRPNRPSRLHTNTKREFTSATAETARSPVHARKTMPHDHAVALAFGGFAAMALATLVGGRKPAPKAHDAVPPASSSTATEEVANMEPLSAAPDAGRSPTRAISGRAIVSHAPVQSQGGSGKLPHGGHTPAPSITDSECVEPFTIDAKGMKSYKRACLK